MGWDVGVCQSLRVRRFTLLNEDTYMTFNLGVHVPSIEDGHWSFDIGNDLTVNAFKRYALYFVLFHYFC